MLSSGPKKRRLKGVLTFWVGQNSAFSFFHKVKDTFLIFTNNFIDLDILSMSAVSCVVER